MKTINVKIETYSIEELKEVNQKAYNKLFESWRNAQYDDIDLSDIRDSLIALLDKLPITYSLGGGGGIYDSYFKCLEHYNDSEVDLSEIKGKRAFAWLENNLLNDLRITEKEYKNKRKEYFSYGEYYRIGQIKSCPLTGVCYDEDFIESLQESIKDGYSIHDAIENLLSVYDSRIEAEKEYLTSEEYFVEMHAGEMFNKDGVNITNLINNQN